MSLSKGSSLFADWFSAPVYGQFFNMSVIKSWSLYIKQGRLSGYKTVSSKVFSKKNGYFYIIIIIFKETYSANFQVHYFV